MASAAQVESRVLKIIERVVRKLPLEDSTVELKGQWPDPASAAWRLGGHANASGGAELLWIVGLDEDLGVTGANREELAAWWPSVESKFDGTPPELVMNLNIDLDGGACVVALLFSTIRRPFVVKRQPDKAIDRGVPFRVGNSTLAATRSNLVRILDETGALPGMTLLRASLLLGQFNELTGTNQDTRTWYATFKAELYVVAAEGLVILPEHQAKASAVVGGRELLEDGEIRLSLRGDPTTAVRSGQVAVTGAGVVNFSCEARLAPFDSDYSGPASAVVSLTPAGRTEAVSVSQSLDAQPLRPDEWRLGRWGFESPLVQD